jgi:DNA-directed RNA polymerase specialized sigma24 family protein
MTADGSVTHLFNQLQQGQRASIQGLWERYFHRLVGLACKKLVGMPGRGAAGEDVALSALHSFCRAAEQGRFPQLADRQELWNLLVLITARKASKWRAYESREKRDWRKVLVEAERGTDSSQWISALEGVLSREPDPAFAAEVAEECERLLASLGDEELRQIVLRKMEGSTNAEIASQTGCSLATVERRLDLIRKRLQKERPGPQDNKPMEDAS